MDIKKRAIAFVVMFSVFSHSIVFAAEDIFELTFPSATVGSVIQALGSTYEVNFSISNDAAGIPLSLALPGVTFSQALEMIEKTTGVKIEQIGAKRYVVTRPAQVAEPPISEDEKRIQEIESRLEHSFMETVRVKYVNVSDVQQAITNTFGEDNAPVCKIASLSKPDGDRNYNSIVVYASSKHTLTMVKKLIEALDKPRPMVEIRAMFLELVLTDNDSRGMEWNPMTSPLKFVEGGVSNTDEGQNFFNMAFGQFWRTTPWEAQANLDMLKGIGRSRVLADPHIRVMSGRKALFASETQVPILQKDSDGEINTEWKNVGISLEILPVALDDGTIQLKVVPSASSITGTKRLGDVEAPIIAERKSETEILLSPGETMVIGGLMNDKEIKTMSKIPILGDIPLLGELFKSTKKETEKSTVVIMLTPTLVETEKAETEKRKHRDREIDQDIKDLLYETQDRAKNVAPVEPSDDLDSKGKTKSEIAILRESLKKDTPEKPDTPDTTVDKMGPEVIEPNEEATIVRPEEPSKTKNIDEELDKKETTNGAAQKQTGEKFDELIKKYRLDITKNIEARPAQKIEPDEKNGQDLQSESDPKQEQEPTLDSKTWVPPID